MMDSRPNACFSCTWYTPDHNYDPAIRPVCQAFPDGIPGEIWSGRSSHSDARDDDHGLQWNPWNEELAAMYLAYWYVVDDDDTELPDEPEEEQP